MTDMNPWVPVLGTLGGALLGGGASFLGAIVGQWMTSKREREAREHESQRDRDRQWSDFQVKTLIDLQSSLDDLIRTAFDAADAMERHSIRRMNDADTAKATESYAAARTRIHILSSRIDDEQTRRLGDEFQRIVARLKGHEKPAGSPETASDELAGIVDQANRKFLELCTRTGELIRKSHRSTW